MSTWIDGIAASENIDSTGEVVNIAGLDITSLAVDGPLNFEHKSDLPEQIVGKIMKAKKIFSEQDCEDDRQKYFWDMCQTPFVYILGELFDDYTDSARHVAGMFRYDHDNRGKNQKNSLSFSIEGAKLPGAKDGMTITRSIARKCTITSLPANKMAIAEMVPANNKQPKDDFDAIFKTESNIEIELFKMEPSMASLRKDLPLAIAANGGSSLGKTKSGKTVTSHGKIGEYKGFSSADHKDAMSMHLKAAQGAPDHKLGRHHLDKMKLHMQAAESAGKRENRAAKAGITPIAGSQVIKAESVGNANVAPSQLTGTAALMKEDLSGNLTKKTNLAKAAQGDDPHASYNAKVAHAKAIAEELYNKGKEMGHTGAHFSHSVKGGGVCGSGFENKEAADKFAAHAKSHPGVHSVKQSFSHGNHAVDIAIKTPKEMKKSESLIRAEQEYAKWEKKEQFRDFMQIKLPHLALGEIDAIGQSIVLKKALAAESILASMAGLNKALKFGTEAEQKSVDAALEERKKNPPKKLPTKPKAPDLKGVIESEVSHTSPMHGDDKYETVHLKSGHELHGNPKGKFKSGDKVVARPHLMGTFLMEHKK